MKNLHTSTFALILVSLGRPAFAETPEDPLPVPSASTDSGAPRIASNPPAQSRVRTVLAHSAGEERVRRYAEGALGLAGSGALIGVGFAAEGPDMTWSHALWISSGVAGLASLAHIIFPGEIEVMQHKFTRLSDEKLLANWGRLARRAKVERQVGAVFGGLLGATTIVFGGLVLDGQLGDLTDEQRRIFGTTLLAGGSIGVVESATEWFVPSPIESGYSLASPRENLSFSMAPTPSGLALGLSGAF
jgi:hypothetical protein